MQKFQVRVRKNTYYVVFTGRQVEVSTQTGEKYNGIFDGDFLDLEGLDDEVVNAVTEKLSF